MNLFAMLRRSSDSSSITRDEIKIIIDNLKAEVEAKK